MTDNLFDSFKTTGAIMAFVHASYGEAGLRELLSLTGADRWDVAELQIVGLPEAALIAAEFAAANAEPVNPFPDNTPDAVDWDARQARKAKAGIR